MMNKHLLNSLPRGNLVDGLPRAASFFIFNAALDKFLELVGKLMKFLNKFLEFVGECV